MTPASVRGADAKKMLASLITRFTGSALVTFMGGLPTIGQYTTQFKSRGPSQFGGNVKTEFKLILEACSSKLKLFNKFNITEGGKMLKEKNVMGHIARFNQISTRVYKKVFHDIKLILT